MVSQEIINKILTNILIKCGYNTIQSNSGSWGVRFPQKVRDALNSFHHRTCTLGHQQKYEELLLTDNEGNEVFSETGGEHSVSFSLNRVSSIREKVGHELYDTHNHPHGFYGIPTCLSMEDMGLLMDKSTINSDNFVFKSVSASTANGSRMTVMKNNNFNESNFNDYTKACGHLVSYYKDYVNAFKEMKVKVVNEILADDSNIAWSFTDKDMIKYVNDTVLERMGKFENHLQNIREEFNKCNVELSVEWVVKS